MLRQGIWLYLERWLTQEDGRLMSPNLRMWELDHKEDWAPKNWCFQIVVLEKTLESSLEIKPVNPKRNQPWIFIGRTHDEAETPILWSREAKSWLTGRFWCWKRLKARGEGGDRGWDGWMASLTQWTWVWPNSWRTGKPSVLQSMGSQGTPRTREVVSEQQQQQLVKCPFRRWPL